MTLDNVPFATLLGIQLDSVQPGHAVLHIPSLHLTGFTRFSG